MIPLLLQLRTVLAFATIIVATWAAGNAALPYCSASAHGDRRSRLVWEMGLGLLVWGTLLTVLGLIGLLYAEGIVAATLAAAAMGVVRIRREALSRAAVAADSESPAEPMPVWLRGLLVVGGVVALGGSFLAALAPPLAGDALCYHLELPKRFLADHALTFYRDNDNSTFPLLAEMWFLWGLAIDGPTGAQLMHWFCGVVLAGAAYVTAVPLVGRRWSLGVAAIVLLAPGINNQMTAPLNDVALAIFTTLAFAAWSQHSREREPAWLLLGLMIGGAAAVKYTAIVFAGVLGVVAILTISCLRVSVRPQWIRGACAAVALSAVVAGPWYLRSAYYRGDPVYPFLSAHSSAGAPSTFPESKTPLGRGLGAVVEAPWAMTMEPERFGGRGHQLGPLFLMLVPCVVWAASRRELRTVLIVAGLYGTGCVLLRQNVRFLLPLVPLLAVIAIGVLREIVGWQAAPRRIAFAAIGAVLLMMTAVPAARVRPMLAVAVGLESREAFLARREPTFESAEWINRNLPAEAHVLSQEQRAFYYDPKWTRENIYRRHTAYNLSPVDATTSFDERLKADGFTHLFLAETLTPEGTATAKPGYDATLTTLADTAMGAKSESAPVPVREWRSEVAGETRRYRLLLLR